ncbi:Uncharacterised protein [uncultured archaeon]|nr:Uncharacterised protein [uncultured archaeon]
MAERQFEKAPDTQRSKGKDDDTVKSTDLVQALLIDEESARKELIILVNDIIECKIPQDMFVQTVEQTLLAVRDYMNGCKDLSDAIKGAPPSVPAMCPDCGHLAIHSCQHRDD